MNYQYVVIQGDTDYYKIITKKTQEQKEAIVISGLFQHHSCFVKALLMILYRFAIKYHLSILLNLLARTMIKIKINPEKKICFLIWSWYANDVKNYLGEYLRKKYKGCKIVCRFEDIIEKMAYKNIAEYRDAFDYLLTFDEKDAQKYDLDYYPSWYDKYDIQSNGMESDVLFVGKGKDRMPEIIEVFEKLYANNVKCLFYLVDVPKSERKYEDKIIYGEYLPYEQVLQLIANTRCLLEILQKDALSETLRVFEAITYNKKLLTNNSWIQKRSYYDSRNIHYYEKATDINIDFIIDKSYSVKYDTNFEVNMRPVNMLKFIDNKIRN